MHFQFNQKWIPLRKRLLKKDLTLSQLRSIEDEALLLMSDAAEPLGNQILTCICEKREELLMCAGLPEDLGGVFMVEEPLVHEFDAEAIESTFSSRMLRISKMIRRQHSVAPYQEYLNGTQKREISLLAGEAVSPEVLAHAVDAYVAKLRGQIQIAESLYFGRMKEGMEGLSRLSSQVRQRVDEIIWQMGQTRSPEVVIAAIMYSVEEQMGMHEEAV